MSLRTMELFSSLTASFAVGLAAVGVVVVAMRKAVVVVQLQLLGWWLKVWANANFPLFLSAHHEPNFRQRPLGSVGTS